MISVRFYASPRVTAQFRNTEHCGQRYFAALDLHPTNPRKQLLVTKLKMPSSKMWLQVVLGGALLFGSALFGKLPGTSAESCAYPCIPGSEDIMKPKEHGTSHTPVQENLRWGCDYDTADRICNYNRHYAEYSG